MPRVPTGKRIVDMAIMPFRTRVNLRRRSASTEPMATVRVMSVVPSRYCAPESIRARIGISQLGADRVAKTTDVVKEGDKVWVKLMGFDERGKVRLSMKVVDQASGQEIRKDAEDAA